MGIAGENVRDPQILHDHHRREVHERDGGLVVILQSQLIGLLKLLGGEEYEPMAIPVERFEQPVRKLSRTVKGRNTKEGGEKLRKHMIAGDVTRFLATELAMLTGGRSLVRVFGISQRQPSPGVNEDRYRLRSLSSIEP